MVRVWIQKRGKLRQQAKEEEQAAKEREASSSGSGSGSEDDSASDSGSGSESDRKVAKGREGAGEEGGRASVLTCALLTHDGSW